MHYGMLPEWANQAALWLIWPSHDSDWAARIEPIRATYLRVIEAVQPHQPILVITATAEDAQSLKSSLARVTNLHLITAPSNDTWIRDFSPITVNHQDGCRLIQFNFNGWGNKYPHDLDATLSQTPQLQRFFSQSPQPHPLTVEGGNLESNGQGCVIVAKESLTFQRNPDWSFADILSVLREQLQAQQILVIDNIHLEGDDTDGHIDNLVRFADANTLLYCACDDETDQHFATLQNLSQQLAQFTDTDGNHFQMQPITIPKAIYNEHGQRLPASYLNFIITNHHVLVPTFNDAADTAALATIAAAFPSRQIIGIDSTELIQQYGGLHCASAAIYQEPS